jgi:hypothetical protein
VEYLVEQGADFLVKNDQGRIPGEEAYEKGFFEISEYLIDREYSNKTSPIYEEVLNEKDVDPDLLNEENIQQMEEDVEMNKENENSNK